LDFAVGGDRHGERAVAARASDACTSGDGRAGAAEAGAFIPFGVLGRAVDDASALVVGSSVAVVSETSSRRMGLPRPGMEERPGVIEIDLADGSATARVPGLVNSGQCDLGLNQAPGRAGTHSASGVVARFVLDPVALGLAGRNLFGIDPAEWGAGVPYLLIGSKLRQQGTADSSICH
jgi:hypothetical protein